MKKLAIRQNASDVLGQGVAQFPPNGFPRACGEPGIGGAARMGGALNGTSRRHSKAQMLASLFLGAWFAASASLSANALSSKSPLDVNAPLNGAPANGQRTPAQQQPTEQKSGPASNRSSGQPQATKQDGNRPQDKPAGQDKRPGRRPPRPYPGPGRPPGQNYPSPRPPVYHHPHYGQGWPSYAWGGGNGWRLHQFFLGDMRGVNRWHRPYFFPGGYFPAVYLDRMQPIPPELMWYLPPVPPGYEIGYFEGYCLVFDPISLRVVSVIDLYRY
jgi:hypothetical protein